MKYKILRTMLPIILFSFIVIIIGCKEENGPIAPYEGKTNLQDITIEQNSYNPKITWLGGYVTTLAVNKGNNAILDSSLIWIINSSNDAVTYPATYGSTPKSGEENLTELYGGIIQESLTEDNIYTFWIAQENVWSILASNTGKMIHIDSSLIEGENYVSGDSLLVAENYFSKLTYPLDVFINVDESSIQNRGRLGTISIEQTNTSNNINITWEFNEESISDLSIAAMGICEGQQFDINNQVWDLYSIEQANGENIYGSKNIITQPISLGNDVEETRVFYEFPETGLERNKNYYLWIATNEWDGESRGRTANGYATITFETW